MNSTARPRVAGTPHIVKQSPTPRKTRNGKIVGSSTAFPAAFGSNTVTAPGLDLPAFREKSIGILPAVEPMSPAPGDTAGGNTGNEGGLVPIPGLGLSWEQAIGVYDRVQDRKDEPPPVAPGASTGRRNRPDVAPSPAQTPTPAPALTGTLWTILALAAGAGIGWAVGGWIGAIIGAVLAVLVRGMAASFLGGGPKTPGATAV